MASQPLPPIGPPKRVVTYHPFAFYSTAITRKGKSKSKERVMNHTHYQITKDYLRETHAQAYRDYLARSLQPSFRERLAKVLTTFAVKLQGNTPTPTDLVSFRG
jgi:hypothetical protein